MTQSNMTNYYNNLYAAQAMVGRPHENTLKYQLIRTITKKCESFQQRQDHQRLAGFQSKYSRLITI